MPYLIGSCLNGSIPPPPPPDTVPPPGDGGPIVFEPNPGTTPVYQPVLNEVIEFNNIAMLDLEWTATRRAKYGQAGSFNVYITDPDGVLRWTKVEITPNDLLNPTNYHFDFGGPQSGIIVIN